LTKGRRNTFFKKKQIPNEIVRGLAFYQISERSTASGLGPSGGGMKNKRLAEGYIFLAMFCEGETILSACGTKIAQEALNEGNGGLGDF